MNFNFLENNFQILLHSFSLILDYLMYNYILEINLFLNPNNANYKILNHVLNLN